MDLNVVSSVHFRGNVFPAAVSRVRGGEVLRVVELSVSMQCFLNQVVSSAESPFKMGDLAVGKSVWACDAFYNPTPHIKSDLGKYFTRLYRPPVK